MRYAPRFRALCENGSVINWKFDANRHPRRRGGSRIARDVDDLKNELITLRPSMACGCDDHEDHDHDTEQTNNCDA